MANGPSGNAVKNRCNILPLEPVQDADGSPNAALSFPVTALSGVPCSSQCHTTQVMDDQGRLSTLRSWVITFRPADLIGLSDPLKRSDRIDLLGSATDTVYLDGAPRDGAGRGNALFATAREVL